MKTMKLVRIEKGITLAALSGLTGITMARLHDIENKLQIATAKERTVLREALDEPDMPFEQDIEVACRNRVAFRRKLADIGIHPDRIALGRKRIDERHESH